MALLLASCLDCGLCKPQCCYSYMCTYYVHLFAQLHAILDTACITTILIINTLTHTHSLSLSLSLPLSLTPEKTYIDWNPLLQLHLLGVVVKANCVGC